MLALRRVDLDKPAQSCHDVEAVTVADTLPAGHVFASASDGGSYSSGVVTWPTVATLAYEKRVRFDK